MSQSEVEPTDLLSFRGVSNVDVCAQELGTAEDEEGDKQEAAFVDDEIVDSEEEEKTEAEEPVEVRPYSGLADVDVCATELRGTERTVEGATSEDDTHDIEERESSKTQPKETVVQSSLSQQEAEDQAEKTKEEEGTEAGASSVGMHESLAHIEGGLDSNVLPKEDSLVEISFEDVPEAQQIKEEKQPEEEDSVEALQTKILEMHQKEESKGVTAVATDQHISGTQDHNEPEMVGVGQEVNSEGEEMESQHEAFDILKEKVDTNYSNLNDSDDDDEKEEGVKNIRLSHQPTTEADEENPEDETDHKREDNEKRSEGELHQRESNDEPDFKEDETTDMVGGDKEDIHTEGYSEVEDHEMNDIGAENHSSEVTQSNISTAATEAEGETLEASAQHLPEENEESERTLVESQPEDTEVENEVTSKERTSEAEELVEEGEIDSEMQEKSDAICGGGSISPIQSADRPAADHQGEERPLGSEKDFTEPEGSRGDKVAYINKPFKDECESPPDSLAEGD
ncbi:retinitis pigmentosa 1-like 1 protein [Enoplosus armatus]|uniref:retinitis pigmentosa 1-like 1 protein n=1 Tax=Enoplosus armatus TaxID=215367 RepID=UPI00399467EA